MNTEAGFDKLYGGHGPAADAAPLAPWDIGRPQPVVEQLAAYGALRGEVLDPGTGPGHHAIHYALQGYPVTAVDESPVAIELAKRNAERAGASVNFRVADATRLDGFEGRFDTVVDVALYHVFEGDEATQTRYAQALHRATRPGARLFMFENGCGNVNGLDLEGLRPENFEQILPAAGWRIDHIGTATLQSVYSPEVFEHMFSVLEQLDRLEDAVLFQPWLERLRILEPLLDNYQVHTPALVVSATRLES